MIRVRVSRAVLLEDDTPSVETRYAEAVGRDGQIRGTTHRADRAAVLTQAQAEQVARYYLRRPKPGKITYEEVFTHAAG